MALLMPSKWVIIIDFLVSLRPNIRIDGLIFHSPSSVYSPMRPYLFIIIVTSHYIGNLYDSIEQM